MNIRLKKNKYIINRDYNRRKTLGEVKNRDYKNDTKFTPNLNCVQNQTVTIF